MDQSLHLQTDSIYNFSDNKDCLETEENLANPDILNDEIRILN